MLTRKIGFFSQNIQNIMTFGAAAALNGGTIICAYQQRQKIQTWYSNLPEEKQKKVYDSCSEQKISHNGDMMSAMVHHGNPGSSDTAPQKVPYRRKL